MRKTNQIKKSNFYNNAIDNIKSCYIKTPKEIVKMNELSDRACRVYIYLLGLKNQSVYVTYDFLASKLGKDKDYIKRALKELRECELLKTSGKGKNNCKYELVNFREEKEEEKKEDKTKEQESQAEQDQEEQQESQAEQDQEEQEIIEDFEEMTENEKKIYKFNDLYKQYCTSCTKIIKDVKESKIIYIMDKYNEIDIIKTLKEFNKFIEVNEGKYKDNYKYLITNFGRLFKKETNKFNNFTQRNYTKSDFKKLEKSFFNNNSDVGADAEKKNQESRADAEQDQEHKNNNRKKEDKIYKITEEDKKYTKAYVMQKELVSHLIEIYANIFKIHKPTTQAEYMKALEIECNKYIPKNNKIHDFQERNYMAKEVLEIEQNFYI